MRERKTTEWNSSKIVDGGETPPEKTVENVTEEDDEAFLPREVREQLKGYSSPFSVAVQKDKEQLKGYSSPVTGAVQKDRTPSR